MGVAVDFKNTGAWGKLQRNAAGQTATLALESHCIDVAATFKALVEHSHFGELLSTASERPLTRSDFDLLIWAAFLHDLGKCNAGFQAKAGHDGPFAGHVREIAGLLGRSELPEGLRCLQDLGTGSQDRRFWLLLAAASHHGDPLKAGLGELQGWSELARAHRRVWSARGSYDPMIALRALAGIADHLFAVRAGSDELKWLPDAASDNVEGVMFLHVYAGVVSLADWIASNAAPGFFPYDGPGDGHTPQERWIWAQARAEAVIAAMRLDVRETRRALSRRQPTFPDTFSYAPRDMQAAMADLTLGQIVCLEAPTGSGKTEAALWRYKTLFEAGLVDGLYMALPMRIAARQIHGRMNDAFARLFPDTASRPNVVLAVPGYIIEGADTAEKLAGFDVLWPDREDSKAHLRWAAENAKRFLAAAAAAGTIDQAVLAGLQTRHAHLRGVALARSLLVVDEVHASDPYQIELLRGLLSRHVALGGHALLMSATLGAEARMQLLQPDELHVRPPSLDDAVVVPYPVISDARGIRKVGDAGPAREVTIATQSWMRDAEAVAAAALHAAESGAMVLVIRNTASGAIEVQRALEDLAGSSDLRLFRASGLACPHHGRFAGPDRQVLDRAVERAFGKLGDPRSGVVLVGTQTLEISLDIDADFLITDLAPVDVLLQRLGRLHRHARPCRPAAFSRAQAILLTPTSRDLSGFLRGARNELRGRTDGLGTVYQNLLAVEATWRLAEARAVWRTPEDNRLLVEESTHPERLRALAEVLGREWRTHEGAMIGAASAEVLAARRHALDWSIPWDEQPWAGDEGLRVKTRLGLDAARIRFDAPVRSPFGQDLMEIAVPGWMLDGAVNETPVQPVPTADGFSFEAAGKRLAYSRLGLETSQ